MYNKISITKKLFIKLVVILLLYSCKKELVKEEIPVLKEIVQLPKQTITTEVKNSIISLPTTSNTKTDLAQGINWSSPGTTFYVINGVEHLIVSPTLFYKEPLIPAIHLIKKNEEWTYEDSYTEGAFGAGRDSKILDNNGTIIFADHGFELSQGIWPFGNLMLAKSNGDKITWSSISTDRSFYHSVSIGDLNNDGLTDIIGLHMGTKGTWNDNLHTYLQKSNGLFEANRNIISYDNFQGLYGAGAVLIVDILGDPRPEIIRTDYGADPRFPRIRYSFAIFSFSAITGKYEYVKTPGVYGFAATNAYGVSSLKAADLDKDGDQDLVIAYEADQINGVEIWTNNGNGNFVYSNQRIEYNFSDFQFREFEIVDVDNDGWLDIMLNPFNGKLFKTYTNGPEVLLHNLLWKNNKGFYQRISKEQKLPFIQDPAYIKTFVVNNKMKIIGIRGNDNGTMNVIEITPVF